MAEKVCAPRRAYYIVFESSPTRTVRPGRRLASYESRLEAIEFALDLIATSPRHVVILFDGEIVDKFTPHYSNFHHTYVAPAGSIPSGMTFAERYVVK